MKILLMMDPGILVPPKGYGGHERLVAMFAQEYKRLGHEVHLLVTTGSFVEGCTMHPIGKEGFPPVRREARKAIPRAWKFLWKHRHYFDMVHNFGRLAYLLPILNYPVKKIMTYGREITGKNIRAIEKLPHKNIIFTGCSNSLISRVSVSSDWRTVYNAIDFNKYTLQASVPTNAPLVFLGRIEKIKGCHTAIKVALETGNDLIIAGNISPLAKEIEYYRTEVEPFIDGKQIRYLGPVNDQQKNACLRQAKALLFPIEWNEPFGMVMIEAMACGTPVIGFNRGSVPEVIDEGKTGFIVKSIAEMKDVIKKLPMFDRIKCRTIAESRFNIGITAQHYLDIFNKPKHIVIITSGQPSANPRVVKEAISMAEAGYAVSVIYVPLSPWANDFDKLLFKKTRYIKWLRVGYAPKKNNLKYTLVRLRRKFFEWSFKYMNGLSTAYENAYILYAPELKRKALSIKGDLYIAHNLGALPAAIKAAAKWKAPVGFDAEDFHRGETSEGALYNLAAKIEDKYISHLDYLTAASPLIAEAYSKLYPGISIISINNAFSKKMIQPIVKQDTNAMRLFWFSQIVGVDRGLETVIDALNLLITCRISLHILGNCNEKYKQHLLQLSKNASAIHFLNPVPPDDIFKISAKYDIGLATEVPYSENRKFCLTNKLFTYILAGNCIVASDTPAQKKFMEEHPGIGLLYESNDPLGLAGQLQKLYSNKNELYTCRITSHSYANCSLNWETEFQKLSQIIIDITNMKNQHKRVYSND
ncbi:MAG: glycosyltransferase [Ginsengibacter sp.]